MMVTFLLATRGHKKVMAAFDYFRAIMKEKTRFQILVTSLVYEPVDPNYQVSQLVHVHVYCNPQKKEAISQCMLYCFMP